ncbi:outer membrane lipoprotein-sorting protein [Ketobacter sp. MCCC 1A13808]|uniref:outer membrane lipoprotein-sorting protein n=1 Tax=Ketobacter sp. MCCC 1A13808 TaxID=2602738 RepID=UPI0012EC9BD4|nr:outer membrane lipoprotein-sorting protein [Ketobacter sp. MCCC 1A13808]MVF10626.1 outer membrane lipoprotein-sorting protein [Ketobacter sp. MCCC 1A13808]
MNLKIKTLFPMSMAAMILIAGSVQAETPEEKGYAIFNEAEVRGDGYVDSQSDMVMILKNKQEATSEREMSVKGMEGSGDEGDKTLMVFLTPRDQKGTALLTHQHDGRDDDQWLYLPALKRVKKIASSKKSGPFMGSEFSFEDIGGQSLEDYTYKYLKDEKYDGQDCFVVESYPKDKNSGYTRVVTWVDKEHYRTLKAEFYDRKNSHLKTMTSSGFKLYLDKFWRPDELLMVNHQTGRSTVLQQKNTKFDTGLSDSDFNKNSLKRAR